MEMHVPAFAEVNITLDGVDPKDHDRFESADFNEFGDGTEAPFAQLGHQNHALHVVVLKKGDISSHLCYSLNLYHNQFLQIRKLALIKAHIA